MRLMPTGLPKTGRSDLPDLRRLQPDSAQIQELKALTRDQDALIQSQTRLVNQLTACLKAYYPVALQWFTKVQQHSSLVFLQTYPTPDSAKAASLDEMTAILKQAHHPNPTKAAQHIWHTLRQPYLQADAITTRTKARLMLALVSQLLPLVEQITAYDKEITRLFLRHQRAVHSHYGVMNARSGRARVFNARGEIVVNPLAEPGDERAAGLDAVAQFRRRIVHLREGLPRVLHQAIHTRQSVVHDP